MLQRPKLHTMLFLLPPLLTLIGSSESFLLQPNIRNHGRSLAATDASSSASSLLEDLRSKRVKELKSELDQLGISTHDLFEKEQLVQRVLETRQKGTQKPAVATKATTTTTTTTTTKGNTIITPLYFMNLDTNIKARAINGADMTINPSDQPYGTIEIQVESSSAPFTLTLLLDTACSGLVIRPSIVDKHNLPKFSNPVTMTGASGAVGGDIGLTRIEKFRLGHSNGRTFGPLPAAVQEIGALPAGMDGIIGLSFLSQFQQVELNFEKGQAIFQETTAAAAAVDTELPVAASANMFMLPAGVYGTDVWFGSRGPVKMLVDSGAASTFLNWKGVEDMGLSRGDSFVKKLTTNMGAMGSDSVAMRLTHRIHASSSFNLGTATLPGIALKGSKRLTIDIGDIGILDQMRPQGIGGILGIDALMRCSSVRMSFRGSSPKIELLLRDSSSTSHDAIDNQY